MPNTSEDKQDRLSSIWTEWGLQPDTATGDALQDALGAADTWLQRGSTDPEIVIRAVQVLLVDPERPDVYKRSCWSSLRKAIRSAWGNAMTAPEHVLFGQSLVLAAWPREVQDGWFFMAPLLDSAWDLVAGRGRQQDEMTRWREGTRGFARRDTRQVFPHKPETSNVVSYESVDLSGATKAISVIQQNQNSISAGNQIVQVLTLFQGALRSIDSALQALPPNKAAIIAGAHELPEFVERSLVNMKDELNLLWWGQARYCETVRKPFRRFAHPEDVVWWAAREAAVRARAIDVEPAAAYLIETLHNLGQDIFEKRPLFQWMEELYASLKRAPQLAPALSDRLTRYAREDAVGLPVTWVRLRAAQNESLDEVAEKVALDLKAEIDRGQWASWIFRESLLDLHLAGDS
ncbi:MAG TPA: GTPase-associated system all-helical protein GASH [Polyangiaceae bacterium]|nr:GTPase-associated system all-helical protein GASH [Polyangiaceae bacterium]